MENDDVKVCNICKRVYRVSRYGDWCPECKTMECEPKQMVEFLNVEV